MSGERILLVEDDRTSAAMLSRWLTHAGFVCEHVDNCTEGLAAVSKREFDLVFLDYVLPDGDGIHLLKELRPYLEDCPVIFITAHGSVDIAVEAMKAGAEDYITKPLTQETVILRASRVLLDRSMAHQLEAMRSTLKYAEGAGGILANSPAMRTAMERVALVSQTGASTVLLLGESGVGKNLIAQEIHDLSDRASKPFMAVLCTSLPGNLLESELFGHERGAFTDAKNSRPGLVELADGGTLFLDEVGELPLALQAKLLHFLESKAYRRVGGNFERKVDVRVVAATNRDLAEEVRAGHFRMDLYYRLNVVEIRLPSLRERPEDIPHLVEHFIKVLNPKLGKHITNVSPQAMRALSLFPWPGNIRELRNAIERAMILTRKNFLSLADFQGVQEDLDTGLEIDAIRQLGEEQLDLVAHEKGLIRRALELASGNQSQAARMLGITRNTLLYRIKKFKL